MKFYLSKIQPILAGILIFFNTQPYFLWRFISIPYFKLGLDMLTLVLFWYNLKNISRNTLPTFVLFTFTLLLMAFLNGLNLFGIIGVVILAAIPFVKEHFLKSSYVYFRNFYSIIMLCSLLVLLLLIVGLPIPYNIIPPLNTLKIYDYTAYPFLVIPGYGISAVTQIGRFCGPFDEPGVVGTVGVILLYIEKFNLRKWQNIIILISGLISFSLFFYLATLVFATYFVFFDNSRFIVKVLTIIGLTTLLFFSFQNEDMNDYIWNRVQWDSEKSTIVGDNRAIDGLDSYFNKIQGTKVFYWGLGLIDKNLMKSFDGSAGYRNAILRYGFVSSALYCLFFFLFAYKQIGYRREYLLFLLIFITTLYQRPGLLLIHYIYLFVVFIMLNSKRELLNGLKQSVLKKKTFH